MSLPPLGGVASGNNYGSGIGDQTLPGPQGTTRTTSRSGRRPSTSGAAQENTGNEGGRHFGATSSESVSGDKDAGGTMRGAAGASSLIEGVHVMKQPATWPWTAEGKAWAPDSAERQINADGTVYDSDDISAAAPMVTIVHWGCRMAQGLLAGVCLGTILLVANAGGTSQSTAAKVLAVFGAAPNLLPALRYATSVLATLAWVGAAWACIEFQSTLTGAAAVLTLGVPGPSGPGSLLGGPAWASVLSGPAGQGGSVVLASGGRAIFALVAYTLVVASVWGCMPSDSHVHAAAAAVAAATSGSGASLSLSAAAEAQVSEPALQRHVEAWITLAAARLVCAVTAWLVASSTAVAPSGVDKILQRNTALDVGARQESCQYAPVDAAAAGGGGP